MKVKLIILSILFFFVVLLQFSFKEFDVQKDKIDSLKHIYNQPIKNWPKPTIDAGVEWEEFAPLSDIDKSYLDSMEKPQVLLGKLLFFDPMLSGSSQISCSSCHNPQTSFADKLSVSVGNDHLTGKRNTISLLNVAARKTLFWDGRASTLEEQAMGPIAAHDEMAMDVKNLPEKIAQIRAYKDLFKEAYGNDQITFEKITSALARFQRTITSRKSRFDAFLEGKYNQLTDEELIGMDLFRNKARCMNCHNGKFLTDESFHNIGLTYYKRKYEDLGRYNITKDPNDVGKFRTPSLRDVMHTGPWMHNGLFDNMTGILNMYNNGMQMNSATPEQKGKDPLFPTTDPLLKKLNLTNSEIQSIVKFLESITATQYKMPRPEKLPRDN